MNFHKTEEKKKEKRPKNEDKFERYINFHKTEEKTGEKN